MSNQFDFLDDYFPTGPNRTFGEVVSVSVDFWISTPFGKLKAVLSYKRKAWYVNASTNAFILHRGLCKQLSDSLVHENADFGVRRYKLMTSALAAVVSTAYMANYTGNNQYFKFQRKLVLRDNGNSCLYGPGIYGSPDDSLPAEDDEVLVGHTSGDGSSKIAVWIPIVPVSVEQRELLFKTQYPRF